MCTVTYLPMQDGFILTSNRDESPLRKTALAPNEYSVFGQSVFFPKDLQANGTWVATSRNGVTLCLLNGAFEKHKHTPPYKISRGIMLLEFFRFNGLSSFVSSYEFSGIEPFTLIVLEETPTCSLHELRWDGHKLHLKSIDASKPAIWSSKTLYTQETIEKREYWFEDWLTKNESFEQDSILDFHHFAGHDDMDNGLIMNRSDRVQTLSITSIIKNGDDHTILYEDLTLGQISEIKVLNSGLEMGKMHR